MEKPIVVSFRWSEEEIRRMHRMHMRYSVAGKRYTRIAFICGPLGIFFGTLALLKGDYVIAAIMLLTGLFLFCLPWLLRRSALKNFSQRMDRNSDVVCEINGDGLMSRNDFHQGTTLWKAVRRAFRVPDGFMLYLTDEYLLWLPAHAFQNPADMDRVAEILSANVKEYKSEV
jgi:YcxB-like protein